MFQRGSILAWFGIAVVAIVFLMPYHPIANLLGQTGTGSVLCGNGIVNENEQCDDGNALAGDGCSVTCTNECVYGSVCRSNTCVYLTSCSSTGAVLPDLSFACDSDIACGGTDDTFAGVNADEQQYQCCDGACRVFVPAPHILQKHVLRIADLKICTLNVSMMNADKLQEKEVMRVRMMRSVFPSLTESVTEMLVSRNRV